MWRREREGQLEGKRGRRLRPVGRSGGCKKAWRVAVEDSRVVRVVRSWGGVGPQGVLRVGWRVVVVGGARNNERSCSCGWPRLC